MFDPGAVDLSVRDAGVPTDAASDLATPDLASFDLRGPDLATPDLIVPDLARPDLTTVDLAAVDALDRDASGPVVVHEVAGVMVSTLAGSDVAGGQDGTGAAAELDNPVGVALDQAGQLLVTEYDGNRVRVVSGSGETGTLTAETGFVGPFAVLVLDANELLVQTDFDPSGDKTDSSGTIWRVPFSTGVATPLAQGLGRPRGLALLAGGKVAVTDREHDTVSILDPATGALTLLAGGADEPGYANDAGARARFDEPIGIALLPDGALAIADAGNHCLRRVAMDGAVTTLAGAPEPGMPGMIDGTSAQARFDRPAALAIDLAGTLYVSDTIGHRIRRVRPDGTVETLAGDGLAGFRNGAGASAEFYGQEGLAVVSDGSILYVADGNAGYGSAFHRLRHLTIP